MTTVWGFQLTDQVTAMDFQVVVLAGGASKSLTPIVSKEVPKALLPVANRPVLSYVLELLESSELKDLIVVVEGADAAVRVGSWISSAYADRLNVEVAAVAEDVGTAGALRAVSPHFTANDIMIVSGDLVSDIPPGAVAATHRRHDAVVTALLCNAPDSGSSDTGSSAGKDKAKKQGKYNVVGLDSTQRFLLLLAAGADVDKDIRVQKSIIQAAGQVEIRADLMDAHLYAFNRRVLQEILVEKDKFQSIRQDILPYLIKSQLRSELSTNGLYNTDKGWLGNTPAPNIETCLSQRQASAKSSFHDLHSLSLNDWNSKAGNDSAPAPKMHKCCAYIASKSKYCARLNSIQAFCDINRDVIGEASYLSGYSFSQQNNIIHPSAQLGSKTTVGPQCMLDEGSQLGDKCSVKRSVIGRHCRIGSNVKIVNSIVMNHVTVEDGCLVQGSVICSNVQIQERAVLKDCQIGAGYVVTAGSELKAESLAKK